MANMTYGSSVVKVIEYLMSNKGRWITEDEIINIAPQFGERIIDVLITYRVVVSTKDGICYDDDDALKRFVRNLGVNID